MLEKTIPQFIKKNVFKRAVMPLDELKEYYRQKRIIEQDKEIKHLKARERFYPVVRLFLQLRRFAAKQKLVIIGDKRFQTNRPKIYALTHIGGDDVAILYEAFNDHCYWLFGDFGSLYKKFEGILFYLNGVICFETYDKTDRKISLNSAIKVLKKGANLLMSPEGSWNITENKPVMHLYPGVLDMAVESNAEIVPVAIEQYGNTFYVNFGKNIAIGKIEREEYPEYLKNLRDVMATLKWEIWEKHGKTEYKDLPKNPSKEWMEHIQKMCVEVDFPMEDVIRTMYKDKNDIVMQEVQAIRENLIPCKANAFLFNKRLK